jgi:hypothetical protein
LAKPKTTGTGTKTHTAVVRWVRYPTPDELRIATAGADATAEATAIPAASGETGGGGAAARSSVAAGGAAACQLAEVEIVRRLGSIFFVLPVMSLSLIVRMASDDAHDGDPSRARLSLFTPQSFRNTMVLTSRLLARFSVYYSQVRGMRLYIAHQVGGVHGVLRRGV